MPERLVIGLRDTTQILINFAENEKENPTTEASWLLISVTETQRTAWRGKASPRI